MFSARQEEFQFTASEAFGFDDGRLKTADYSRDAGFGLRGLSGEMTGFAHANDISAAAIRRAVAFERKFRTATRERGFELVAVGPGGYRACGCGGAWSLSR